MWPFKKKIKEEPAKIYIKYRKVSKEIDVPVKVCDVQLKLYSGKTIKYKLKSTPNFHYGNAMTVSLITGYQTYPGHHPSSMGPTETIDIIKPIPGYINMPNIYAGNCNGLGLVSWTDEKENRHTIRAADIKSVACSPERLTKEIQKVNMSVLEEIPESERKEWK